MWPKILFRNIGQRFTYLLVVLHCWWKFGPHGLLRTKTGECKIIDQAFATGRFVLRAVTHVDKVTTLDAAWLAAGDPAPGEASITKLQATETAKDVALQGMQFMGGMGYSMESEMQSYVRDALVMTIFGGTSQIQKNIIAAQLGLAD